MKISLVERIIGSGLFTGYIPKASGTFASALALFLFLIPGFENPTFLMLLISVAIVVGVPIATKFEKLYGKDPSQFTLDEFIGTWIAMQFIPKKVWIILPAFILWRLLDIYKPFPAKQIESIKGGWGIILDDVVSGLYSFIIVQLTIHIINRLT